eukprot:8444934-Alexandrium_andersonii.AAC.1
MCVRPGLTYRIHFIIHVGGLNYGGAPQTCPDGEKVIRCYVGNGSDFNFRGPDERAPPKRTLSRGAPTRAAAPAKTALCSAR